MLGDSGQLIRMTRVTPNSWLLVGCRPHGKGADYNAIAPDKDKDKRDDGFENDGRSSGSENSGGSDSDTSAATADDDDDNGRLHREHRRVQVRMRRPWPNSNNQRLLAYKRKMGMKWDDIYPLFPNRTLGAIQAR